MFSQRHPWIHRVLDFEDEVFAGILLLINGSSLASSSATFAEALYGMNRVPAAVPSPTGSVRGNGNTVEQQLQSKGASMSRRQRTLSLLASVLPARHEHQNCMPRKGGGGGGGGAAIERLLGLPLRYALLSIAQSSSPCLVQITFPLSPPPPPPPPPVRTPSLLASFRFCHNLFPKPYSYSLLHTYAHTFKGQAETLPVDTVIVIASGSQ